VIARTEGVVLRILPFSRTSQVVSWFTPDRGRMATLVKGALRPKSAFLGQYDLFYTCEILFYAQAHQQLHLLKEAGPLAARESLRRSWRATAGASYLCDLLWRLCPAETPQPKLYALATVTLDHLAQHSPSEPVLFWFELRFLQALGFAPRLASCAMCGQPLRKALGTSLFVLPRGGILCAACAARGDQDGLRLPPDVEAILRAWQQADTPAQAQRTVCAARQTKIIASILGSFLAYHLETLPDSRAIALALIGKDITRQAQ
jgi:DNA repair protein RecO (recombination protein O)